jgi:hypothetical protein
MPTDHGTLSHPGSTTITAHIDDEEIKVTIRKWKMRDRAELKPRIVRVLEKITGRNGEMTLDLASMMLVAEEEIYEIAKVSAVLPDGKEFDDMDLNDLVDIAQAVWVTNILGPEGGGLMGKLGILLAPILETKSAQKTSNEQNGLDSVSSGDDGGPAPNVSSTN